MKNCLSIISIVSWIVTNLAACVQTYTPAPIQANNNYLVVDGNLLTGQDSTVIKLSRTQNLSDSNSFTPELNAQVSVLDENSTSFALTEQGNGIYWSNNLNLDFTHHYRLRIITSNGKEYLSDTVRAKMTPPIDSVYWQLDMSGVHIYLDTHDPLNNSRYYQWNFAETWQHHASYNSLLQFVNNQLVLRSPSNQIYTCWATMNSTDILVGTSANLEQDIIHRQPITLIPSGSVKISVLYSILVRQYAITQEAYEFWVNLKSNTEQLGTLFDAQPSQLTGNIHCMSNPGEPVLGYISACSQTEARIFIDRYDLTWLYVPPECFLSSITPEQVPQIGKDSLFYVIITQGPTDYIITPLACGDCRYDGGGLTTKPSFWPQ